KGIESATDRACSLYAATTGVPAGIRGTKLMVRIRGVCDYVARRGSGAAVEDHLRYLADLAVDNLNASHARLRLLVGTVPAVGLLGTLVPTSPALQQLDGDSSAASVAAVAGALGGALTPLALGLGLSLILVFGKLLLERGETQVLTLVEQFGIDEL